MDKTKLSHNPCLYFAATFGFSWLFWIPAVLVGQGGRTLPVSLLHYAGGAGPLVVAVVLTYLLEDGAGRRDYWRRAVDFRRIGPAWYAVIVLTFPVLTGLAGLLNALTGGGAAGFGIEPRFLAQPLTVLPYALFLLVFGPIPEELGWRGYALDRLQGRWGALASSLALGAAWAAWHLPLFFMPETYQSGLGVGSLRFWLFFITLVPQSVLYTWIYNNTGRSTLSAILFHFMGNFTGELFALSDRAEVWCGVLVMVAAVGVVATRRIQGDKDTRI